MKYPLLALVGAGLALTRPASGQATADTAQTQPPGITAPAQAARAHYERQKYGFFVHYVPGRTGDTNGKKLTIDELAKDLDAAQFAQDMSDFGVEYVIFTVMHANARMLYPSAVNKHWRDDSRKPGTNDPNRVKTYADTDLIDRLATELEKKGIDFHLYVHPVDGHDFSKEDQDITGWNDCDAKPNDHKRWNDFQNELFGELCKRYGTRIKGLWFDGLYHHSRKKPDHDIIDQARFRETLLTYNPGMILMANVGGVRSSNPRPGWPAADYRAWECTGVDESHGLKPVNPQIDLKDALTWPGAKEQVAMILSSGWCVKSKRLNARYPAESLFRYLVLQASVSKSGGLALAAGCFPGTAKENSNGNIWEGNIYPTMVALGKLVKPVSESIKNTNAGKAYVTQEHQWLGQLPWGVSTESPDGKIVYLHVVKPPSGSTLAIGPTADGSELGGPAILLNTGKPVGFKKTSTGYEINLPEGTSWDTLDTVIKVQRISSK